MEFFLCCWDLPLKWKEIEHLLWHCFKCLEEFFFLRERGYSPCELPSEPISNKKYPPTPHKSGVVKQLLKIVHLLLLHPSVSSRTFLCFSFFNSRMMIIIDLNSQNCSKGIKYLMYLEQCLAHDTCYLPLRCLLLLLLQLPLLLQPPLRRVTVLPPSVLI